MVNEVTGLNGLANQYYIQTMTEFCYHQNSFHSTKQNIFFIEFSAEYLAQKYPNPCPAEFFACTCCIFPSFEAGIANAISSLK